MQTERSMICIKQSTRVILHWPIPEINGTPKRRHALFLLKRIEIPRLQIASEKKNGKAKLSKKKLGIPSRP